MRVAFVAVTYSPSVGGAQLHVQRVAEGLSTRHGHEVRVLTTDALRPPAGRHPGHIRPADEHRNGVRIDRFPVARRTHALARGARRLRSRLGHTPNPRRSTASSPWTVGPFGARFAAGVLATARNTDVMVGVSAPYLTLVAAVKAAHLGGCASVAMPLLHLEAGAPRPLVLEAVRRADGCTASTAIERDWLVANGVRPAAVTLLPPGCDPDAFPRTTPAEARAHLGLPERPTVGCIGRAAPHKGLDVLLAAAPHLWAEHPDTTVLLAGEGTAEWARTFVDAADPRVVAAGGFAEADKGWWFAACDVVVVPSREESFGMVIAEAWAARRPVVASDLGVLRCTIEPAAGGVVFPTGDHRALAGEVVSLFADPERAARLGEAGRTAVEHDLAWDAIVDRWDDFLAATVQRHRAARGAG